MKTLERWVTNTEKATVYTTFKPLMERLAAELGDEWSLTFDDDNYEAEFAHGVMKFIIYYSSQSAFGLKCGNGKINYTAVSAALPIFTSNYSCIDILEADDRNTIVLGFRTTSSNNSSYGFCLIWGKYDDGSEYFVWASSNTSGNLNAILLDDTATASQTFPTLTDNIKAAWCFGKLPKSNSATLPTSLYFGWVIPYRAHYIEFLRGDKKFVGFAALRAGANNTTTLNASMFAVPVETFDIEHIKI